MRNSRYAIFILDSRSDGDRSGTFADVDFLKATIWQSLVDIFAVMGCYINVLGSNSISLSMTLYTFCMLFPFNGGSISNEKAVLLLLLIRSITFMLFIYLGGQMYIKNSYVCLPNMLIVYVV